MDTVLSDLHSGGSGGGLARVAYEYGRESYEYQLVSELIGDLHGYQLRYGREATNEYGVKRIVLACEARYPSTGNQTSAVGEPNVYSAPASPLHTAPPSYRPETPQSPTTETATPTPRRTGPGYQDALSSQCQADQAGSFENLGAVGAGEDHWLYQKKGRNYIAKVATGARTVQVVSCEVDPSTVPGFD